MKVKLVIAGIILLIVLVLVGTFSAINRTGCWWYGKQTEREVRYAPFVGCMVEVNGKWFPRNELRVAQ